MNTLYSQVHGVRKIVRAEMGNKDNTNKEEKEKTCLMISKSTQRLAKLSLYRLKLKNAKAKLEVCSTRSNPIWHVDD